MLGLAALLLLISVFRGSAGFGTRVLLMVAALVIAFIFGPPSWRAWTPGDD